MQVLRRSDELDKEVHAPSTVRAAPMLFRGETWAKVLFQDIASWNAVAHFQAIRTILTDLSPVSPVS